MLEAGVYGAPPGSDFPAALVRGLSQWAEGRSPEALARVTVFVNTRRMQRRARALFDQGPARLLPRLLLVTDIGRGVAAAGLPAPVPPLRRKLELARLVTALVETRPDIAPRAAVFELADSLARLLDEMQGEGVPIEAIKNLDVSDLSGNWQRSREFLSLVGDYLDAAGAGAADPEARLRAATDRLIADWQLASPESPVIVAGSTGSRGTTAWLMAAVARLPTGILLLPGFDFDMPATIWETLARDEVQDHPQYRFARILDELGIRPGDVRPWPGSPSPDPARNRLISLSLRPAPVTDQWLTEGPSLGDLSNATEGLTLVEAPDPRSEAQAIALILRGAVEDGRTAALVTPDRMLTRRVTALLDRWGIEPDDSAGRPLSLSAPGRFLRQVSAFLCRRVEAGALLALLKHPLTNSGGERGEHLRLTREFELWCRKKAVPFPDAAALRNWSAERGPSDRLWAAWIGELIDRKPDDTTADSLCSHVDRLLATAEALAAGPDRDGSGTLWQKEAGRIAWETVLELRREAKAGGNMTPSQADALVLALLERREVREPRRPHPRVMIWGTLEARVQGADLVILGGLNEGSWPETPAPDPWLNRRMRAAAGLLLPERRIGLSAHDYQQAAAAPEVVLSRARKEADAEPVPARWLNRLVNLLAGLSGNGGPAALAAMKDRGNEWIARAAAIDRPEAPVPLARRPAPRPPVAARPTELPVTAIERLIRDPYAAYARYILRLYPVQPLDPGPDAPIRGQILHRVFDEFMSAERDDPAPDPRARLLETAERVLACEAPWPMARRLWFARIERVADWFIETEALRAGRARFLASEVRGRLTLGEPSFTLNAKADRIDRLHDGSLAVLDYKTGSPPTARTMEHFDKQLLLEALIAEGGGFDGIPAAPVDHVAHVGLGAKPEYPEHRLEDDDERRFALPSVRAGLLRLLSAYADRSQGYLSRRAMQKVAIGGDYDHLARFGEWAETDAAQPEDVG